MEKGLRKKEIATLADELNLTVYQKLSELVEGLEITESKNLIFQILCCTKRQFEHLFFCLTGIELSLHSENIMTATISKGAPNIILVSEFGAIGINEENLQSYVAVKQNGVDCRITVESELFTNIDIRLSYVPEYALWHPDIWRMVLLKADTLLMVVEAFHALYTAQKDFISQLIQPLFSRQRVSFGIYNADMIRPDEYVELEKLLLTKLGEDYTVFPIFSENISEKRRAKYVGDHLITVEELIENMHKNTIKNRAEHMHDVESFLDNVFITELKKKRCELEKEKDVYSGNLDSFQIDKRQISESKTHILDNIRLFLENSTLAYYRTSTEQFTKDFKRSLAEDIGQSQDIKQDSRSLPRYISYIWELFTEDQNRVASTSIEKEVEGLFTMIKLDLHKISTSIPSSAIGEKVNELLKGACNINSFFARRTSSGNGLTDALTVGGLIVGIIGAPIGFVVMGVSELIKVLGKNSINEDYKRELIVKVNEAIDKNAQIILQNADKRIQEIIKIFTDEITSFYDELTDSIEQTIRSETKRIRDVGDTLAKIDKNLAD